MSQDEIDRLVSEAYQQGRQDAAEAVRQVQAAAGTYTVGRGPSVYLWDAVKAAQGQP
jgi:hypothetical protein